MDLAERNRLIAVTKGFRYLHGLTYAPTGMLNVAISVANSSGHLNPDSSGAEIWAILALFPCTMAAFVAANLYYRRRFGVVRCGWNPSDLLFIVAGLGAAVGLFAAAYVDGVYYAHPAASYPVSFTCLWWGLLYIGFYLVPYRIRPHSLWFAALFLGLGFLTLMGMVPKSQFFLGSGRAGDILLWSAFAVHGLLDHLLLLRLLPESIPIHGTIGGTTWLTRAKRSQLPTGWFMSRPGSRS